MGYLRKLKLGVHAARQHTAGQRASPSPALRSDEILQMLLDLEMFTYSYGFEPVEVVRCGPMAQSFKAETGFGASSRTIPGESALGVLMIGVQELHRLLQETRRELGLDPLPRVIKAASPVSRFGSHLSQGAPQPSDSSIPDQRQGFRTLIPMYSYDLARLLHAERLALAAKHRLAKEARAVTRRRRMRRPVRDANGQSQSRRSAHGAKANKTADTD